MSDQLELPLGVYVAPDADPELTIAERFERFHEANAWVADSLEVLAADEIANGADRIGVKYLAEVLRWHHRRATTGDPFRLNNSFVSLYARELLDRHPEWADRIETRQLRAA